jgi:CheY-like chemotaxis protein
VRVLMVRPATRPQILVAEDNDINYELVEILLEGAGAEPTWARDGKVAVSMLAFRHFDLILLDLNLPILSGRQVLEFVMADPERSATPVVILTADAMPETRTALIAAGASAFITKPFEFAAFRATVAEMLS